MQQLEDGKFETDSFHGSAFSASTTSLESNFSSVSTHKCISINEEAVYKTMDMHAEDYERKLQLGEIVYKHAKDRGIPEESLSKEYKEAKDLYVKNIEQKVFDFTMVSQAAIVDLRICSTIMWALAYGRLMHLTAPHFYRFYAFINPHS